MTVNKVSTFGRFLVFLYYNENIVKSFTMKQIVNLNFRLEMNEPNQNIPNPVDICQFLNQLLRTKDPLQYGKVIGYNVKFDDIVPYNEETAQ